MTTTATTGPGKTATASLWSIVSVQLTRLPHCSQDGYHIGMVNLKDYPTWESLDHRLSQMWKEYARRVDPTDRLGLRDYRLLAVRVNGNRSDRPISRSAVDVSMPEPGNVSVEGELACLVQEAQMAWQSRTVILAQLVPSGSLGREKNCEIAEWSFDCLEPIMRFKHWVHCLNQYRCVVFHSALDCNVELISQTMAYLLQADG